MNRDKKIVVIGAGPAGASAAYYLTEQGYQVTVLEKEAFVGGRTHGYEDNQVRFDTGASFFTNFYPLLKELVKKLNIQHEVIELERKVGLKYHDQIAEFRFGSFSSFWNLPFINNKDKWIMIWNTIKLSLKRSKLDLVSPDKLAAVDDASIADWATEKMSKNIYHFLIRPGVEPFWYFSCNDVSRAMTTVLQARAADAKFYTFQHGMARISEKLLEKSDLKLNATVTDIKVNGKVEIGYTISNESKQITADYLVMATPATTTAKLLKAQLNNPIGHFISSQKYVHNVHATYLVDEELTKGMYAYYYPCGDWETPIGAIVFHKLKCYNSVKAPKGKELISIYLLDQPSKELMDSGIDDNQMMEKIWELGKDFLPMLPNSKENVTVIKRNEAIPLHEVGRYKQASQLKDEKINNIFFTGDYLSCATVEGGLRSGRWVASKISNKKITF
ncbi:MAG: hypothetical protein CL838_02410 [Crocinitomicaceae bacterium]|nr:hypothetical protein [Crocinitomicaceae bacterium]